MVKVSNDQKKAHQKEINILIIDDNSHFLKALNFSLQEFYKDANITTAESGEIGLNYIKDDGYDIVIIDMLMPKMNGVEVLERIRKMKKDYIVIILTAFVQDTLLNKIKENKPNAIFDKADFSIEKLNPFLDALKG